MKIGLIRFQILMLSVLVATSCKENIKYLPADTTTDNRLGSVLAGTLSLRSFYHTVSQAGLSGTLNEPGPYTLLSYVNGDSIPFLNTGIYANEVAGYQTVLLGQPLSALPLKRNMAFSTLLGPSVFVNKYASYRFDGKKTPDTLITVNGCIVDRKDFKASNGYLDIIRPSLAPPYYATFNNAIENDQNFTFLQVALARTGLTNILDSSQPLTLLAPTDSAFTHLTYNGLSIHSVQDIQNLNAADSATLAMLLLNQIVRGRVFLGNLILENLGYDTILLKTTPVGYNIRQHNRYLTSYSGHQLTAQTQVDNTPTNAPYFWASTSIFLKPSGQAATLYPPSGRYVNGNFVGGYNWNAYNAGGLSVLFFPPLGSPTANGIMYAVDNFITP